MHQDFFAAEANSGKSEHARGKENEALRYHIDKCGNRTSDGYLCNGAGNAEARPKQKCANGDKGIGNVFDDIVHKSEEFGIGGLNGMGGGF